MLEIKALSKTYGDKDVVSDISFNLQAGDVLGFLGRNGAGKSTTLKMISGALEPSSGEAMIAGHSIITERAAAQSILGYLPEGAPLYLEMTPLGFLRFLADAHGLDKATRMDAIDRVQADTRITEVANQPIATLSKGYRRRVALAGALLHDPKVLLLDEPTDGLDPVQKRAVRALISRIAAEKAIILSTHTLDDVAAMCTRVLVIEGGRILADTTPAELAAQNPAGLDEAFISLVGNGAASAA